MIDLEIYQNCSNNLESIYLGKLLIEYIDKLVNHENEIFKPLYL